MQFAIVNCKNRQHKWQQKSARQLRKLQSERLQSERHLDAEYSHLLVSLTEKIPPEKSVVFFLKTHGLERPLRSARGCFPPRKNYSFSDPFRRFLC